MKARLFKLAVGVALAVSAVPAPAQAADLSLDLNLGEIVDNVLPAPPTPDTTPSTTSPRITKRTTQPGVISTVLGTLGLASAQAAATGTNGGGAPGAKSTQKTLILYDSTGPWAWLGEAYAVQTGNLASHGSSYVMHPVGSYAAGEMSGYTGVIYIGSTYDEPIPVAFLDDVLAGSRPVLWMAHNIWQLTARAPSFQTTYGWNSVQSDT